jgi:sterol desaturase/sphingolipid hydroxylase (fatty acid hydroxylase superfamily)
MSYLIVSPDMHKVHHHYKLPTLTVITAIYFQFGTVCSGHSEHFPKKKLYTALTRT